jgi:Domain of unknown function (DUF4390)
MTSVSRRAFVLASLLAAIGLQTPAASAAGESIELKRAVIGAVQESDAWILNAEADITLSGRLEEALSRGVPLYFVLEADVVRSRWYWLNEKLLNASLTIRLSFNALSRTYRVSSLLAQQQVGSLAEALAELGQVRGWRVLPLDRLKLDSNVSGFARLRLDVNQLPKPLQISAITNKELSLQSEWTRLQFSEAPSTAR